MANELLKHRRIHHPTPSFDRWKIECSCGWSGFLSLRLGVGKTTGQFVDMLEQRYREHLPEDEKYAYVFVDARPWGDAEENAIRGVWLMPAGEPCALEAIEGSEDEGHIATISEPVHGKFPVGEVHTPEGRVFKVE